MKSRLRSDERWPDADLHGHFGLGQTGCRREWIAVIASLWTGRGRGGLEATVRSGCVAGRGERVGPAQRSSSVC